MSLAITRLRNDLRNLFGFLIPVRLHALRYQITSSGDFSIADQWDRAAQQHASHTALIFEDKTYTFADMDERIRRAAAHLAGAELPPRAIVALMGHNTPAFFWYAIAALSLGHIPALLRPGSAAEVAAFVAPIARIDALLTTADDGADTSAIPPEKIAKTIAYDPSETFNDTFQPVPRADLKARRKGISFGDVAMIAGTSGTTGPSKACYLFQGALLAYSKCHQVLKGLTKDDRAFNPTSVSHGQGFFAGAFVQWVVGGSSVLVRSLDPTTFWQTCKAHGITVISYCGTVPEQLMAEPPGPHDTDHTVRIAAGHELAAPRRAAFQQRFGLPVVADYFASTEGGYFFGIRNHPTAVGIAGPLSRSALHAELLVLDDDNALIFDGDRPRRAATGEPGELFTAMPPNDPLVRGAYLDAGEEEASKARSLFRAGDKWFRTGDIARADADGMLHFIGKRKSAFRIGGHYANPIEVEDRLMAADRTIALDDVLCEIVHGAPRRYLRLAYAGAASEAEVRAHAAQVLAAHELPLTVERMASRVPRTVSYRRRREWPATAAETEPKAASSADA